MILTSRLELDVTTLATGTVPESLRDLSATFLPVGQMLQISRVTDLIGARIEGHVELGPDHWVFPQHFPHDPIFPGSLMIEAAGQLVALWAWAAGQRGRPRLVRTQATFHHPTGPDSTHLILRGEVRQKRNLSFATVEIWDELTHVASVEAVLAVLPMS